VPELTPSQEFERQIERIHKLIEAEGSEVTWNAHIPDPDSPGQSRQIDISIRRDGLFTHVECRLRKEPQDVTWIEELIGRRLSLVADAIIAVSASGFTATAHQKANRYGIILRDIASLSPQEVQNWGRGWKLSVNFCEFSKVVCTIKIAETLQTFRPQITDTAGGQLDPIVWRLIFQDAMRRLDQDGWPGVPSTIRMSCAINLLVDGRPPLSIEVRASVRRIVRDVSVASLVAYADPVCSTRHAQIGHFDLGKSEVIENRDDVAMIIDLSQINTPDSCCFETVLIDAGRPVRVRPSFIGIEEMVKCKIPITVCLEGPKATIPPQPIDV
jgi:hypothetical protein